MKYLVVLLAAATVTFTGTAMHYARASRQETARKTQQVAVTTAPGNSGTNTAATPPNGADAPNAPPPEATSVDSPAKLALALHRLEQLRDPVTRAQLLEEARDARHSMWQTLNPFVGLSDEELDRFSQQLAEREIERRTRLLECETTPGCDAVALTAASREFAKRDRAELLTPEQEARYRNFSGATSERSVIATFTLGLIPRGEKLPPGEIEALQVAVMNERLRFVTETGREPRGEEYDRRLVRSAAPLLTPSQLTAFEAALAEQRRKDAARAEKSGGQ